MSLVRLLSWPYFKKHLLRTCLTTVGIVLGVSVFVGMRTANESVMFAFSETVDRIAGKTQLQITAGEIGFAEEVLERVQSASTVAAAAPVIEVLVDSNIKGEGSLFVLGVDMTGDRALREYDLESEEDALIDDPLIFLAQPDSLILSKEFADRNGVGVGDRLLLGTVTGNKSFTVRGVIKSTGLATAFGGNLAVMDIYAAKYMFGRGRTFDRIDLMVREGTSIDDCQRQLRGMLGGGFDVQPPSSRSQQFETMLASYSMMVSLSSAFALFIGMFIIYNAFAIAVTQRRSEIGILRALGATRAQIRNLFLSESLVIGLIGSGLGIAAGLLVARVIAAWLSVLIADVYRIGERVEEVASNPWLLAASLGLGVATSIVAASVPARKAARLDPIQALQKGKQQLISASESHLRTVGALACAILSLALLLGSASRYLFYAGYGMAVLAALLFVPVGCSLLAKALRPVLKRIRPVEGTLAADGLIQAPRRTAASVSALMLAIALVVAFEGMARANYSSIVDWMDGVLNPDLFVTPSQSLDLRTLRFPPEMGAEIASVPGVQRVQTLRSSHITYRQTPVMLLAMEMDSVAQTVKREPVAGDASEMYAKASAGQGFLVSDNFARLQKVSLGETLEIPAPNGILRMPVVGVIVDYSDQQGAVLIDRSVFTRYWGDDSVNMFRVYVHPDTDAAAVRQRILEYYDGKRRVFVLTNQELRGYILGLIGQWFSLTTVQTAIAVLVAILGIVNTLTVSITDRRRELAVLQAVGALRGQIRRTIWLEALGIAMLGLILGCGFGAINLYYILEIVQRDISGMKLDYDLPLTTILVLVPTILGAGLVASLGPAESSVRGSLVEALEYE